MIIMPEKYYDCLNRVGLQIWIMLITIIGISGSQLPLYSQAHTSHVEIQGTQIIFRAGLLSRDLSTAEGNLTGTSFQISGEELLQSAAEEVTFTVHFAQPNREPIGIKPGESGVEPKSAKLPMSFPMKSLKHMEEDYVDTKGVEWISPVSVSSKNWNQIFNTMRTQVYTPSAGVTRLDIIVQSERGAAKGLRCTLTYEVYDGYPVVRKWVTFTNHGSAWIKIKDCILEGTVLKPEFRNQKVMAPGAVDRAGAMDHDAQELQELGNEVLAWVIFPSIISFGKKDGSAGVIAGSEIPSAIREIHDDGSMGYRKELFEWVLGPDETFTSEPVFYYGYSGETWETASVPSTPRDRAAERPFRDFVSQHIGVAADNVKLYTPVWSIWEVSWRHVTDTMLREQAPIAARCGFKQIEVDAGWQWDNLGRRVDEVKFPDFAETCRYIESLGMKFSLWISNYRSVGSRDLERHADLRSVPLITKKRKLGDGYGMSYASAWREYFARDLVELYHQYGIIGFKEDHCNIRSGDIGLGHESRTRKESLLRGFRGTFAMKDMISHIAPEVITNVTHETYWDNPNPGADLAVLKHSVAYHIPPNRHDGGEDLFMFKARGKEPETKYYGGAESAHAAAEIRRKAFIDGCMLAREQMYAHRALPMRCLQFFALITINQDGSLTPLVQDRQVCSLLMGAPFLYSGDLTTLTEENINRYANRFELVNSLNKKYDIYKHFQFSGVPVPTDTDWHWWGKLNKKGYGAVVILRGSGGEKQRVINIPWVMTDKQYKVRACFAEENLGTFTGKQLQEGKINLSLPAYGQEILEVAPL